MQRSWDVRLKDAQRDREEVEETTMGCYVEFFMRKFFISEEVIPERCKVYVKGKVKSYNFKGVELNDLVVKEVFRRRVNFKALSESKVDLTDISFRMEALWLILEQDCSDYQGLARNIYSHALLAAIASLFTALSEQKAFADILTGHLQKAFRKKAFHFHFSFRTRVNNTIDLITLKSFASHVYEHCCLELDSFCRFNRLTYPNPEAQRFTPEFKSLLGKCLDTHNVYYEFNNTLLTNLAKDSEQLQKIIALVNEDTQIFCSRSNGIKSRQAIIGNAIGLLAGNMSASVMSLLKDRTYSDKLSDKQKTEIQDQYGCYVQKGCAFRHNEMSHVSMSVYFNISMGQAAIPKSVSKAIEQSKNKLSRSGVKKLPIKYDRKTVQYRQNLWGIMDDGLLAGLSQNLSCHILDPSGGKIKTDVMLNSATPESSYFQHATGSIPTLLLKTRYLVIVAYQYLHLIDMDPSRCEPEKIMRLPEGGGSAIVELDESCFAVGSGSGQVTIHDSETAQILKIFPVDNKLHQATRWVSQMVKLSNNRLACGYNGGQVYIWDIKTSRLEAVLHPSEDIAVLIYDRKTGTREEITYPSLEKAVFPTYAADTVVMLSLPKQTPGVWRGGRPQGTASSLLVSKEGNLFVGYGDKSIALWDMKTFQVIKTYVGHEEWPHALMTLPNGQLVSTGSDKTLRVWNKDGCKKTLKLSHPGFFAKIVGEKVIVADHHHSTEIMIQELTDSTPGLR